MTVSAIDAGDARTCIEVTEANDGAASYRDRVSHSAVFSLELPGTLTL